MKKRLLMLSMLGASMTSQAQLIVTQDTSATNLANAMVGTGTNVTNAVLTCGQGGAGTFSDGLTTNLGMDEGILLMSGDINNVTLSGSMMSSSGAMLPGIADLDAIVGTTTFDGCELEFDVTVAGPTLIMDYVFGSEEYPEFVCTAFNDVFAFFLSGPNPLGGNYTNQNIALVPGSTDFVSINTVNGGTSSMSGPNCVLTNTAYFVDNSAGAFIVFDGFTTPLTATIPTVPGQTYHMRYAVADASDGIMDTGVFLEGGSLKSPVATTVSNVNNSQLATLYPNPSNGKVNVYSKDQDKTLTVRVLNSVGQVVLDQAVKGTATLDLTRYGAGMYIVSLGDGTTMETQRIVVAD